MKINKYGLKRDIPADTERTVRQNSRFGCVICRSAVYTYEHIEPPYVEAKSHDPDRIALLCPTCHSLVTKCRIPKDHVFKKYNEIKKSPSPQRPTDKEFFLHYDRNLKINLGKCEFNNFRSIINIDGVDVLSYKKSDESDLFTVTGIFNDQSGKELFRLEENEWIGPVHMWDVIQKGRDLIINKSHRDVVFHATKNNKDSSLTIKKLNMYFPPFHVEIESGILKISQHEERSTNSVSFEINGSFSHGDCAIYLDSSRASQLIPSTLKIVGGKGLWIEGTGIWIGFGSSQMLLKEVNFHNNGCQIGFQKTTKKSITPTEGQNYFIFGHLETRLIYHPLWTEEQYFINEQRLISKPNSWGLINELEGKKIELFHISRTEPEDLAKNPGFLGFYADDILKHDWSDRIFEVEVEEITDVGSYTRRVKRSEVGERHIVNDVNPKTGKPFHPQEFSGICPWKKNN